LAIALALQANNLTNPPVQAQRALAEVAYFPGTRELLVGHDAAITSLAINRDGTLALTGSDDHTLILWDITTGDILQRFGTPAVTVGTNTPTPTPISGHSARVITVALSPDGTRAFSAGGDNLLILWDVTTGQELRREETANFPIRSMAFSPDGTIIALGSTQGDIELRNVETWELLQTLDGGDQGIVLSVAFSPSGTSLVSGSVSGTVILWDLTTQQNVILSAAGNTINTTVQGRDGHTDAVNSVTFSPDGEYILSGSSDESMILWEVATNKLIHRFFGHNGAVTSVAFNADSDDLQAISASLDNSLIVWDIEQRTEIHRLFGHEDAVSAVAFLPDNRTAISGSNDGTVRVWDVDGSESIWRSAVPSTVVFSVAFSPDSRYVLSGMADNNTTDADNNTLLLWDADATSPTYGQMIRRFSGHTRAVNSAAFSPDGLWALSGSADRTVMVWDVQAGTSVLVFAEHTASVNSVAFSPDGTLALSAAGEELILWEVATGTVVRRFVGDESTPGHDDVIYSAVFSPDGQHVLSADRHGDIILWDTNTGAIIRRMGETETRHLEAVRSVAISPDGQTALSGSSDDTVILWDLNTGTAIDQFLGHTNDVYAVAFSAAGLTALSGSLDGTLMLWDVATGAQIRRYGGEDSPRIFSATFSPNGLTAVSGDHLGNVTLWRVFVMLPDLINWTVANRYVPALTQEECLQLRIASLCDNLPSA
jgi:WD40 repeat protein